MRLRVFLPAPALAGLGCLLLFATRAPSQEPPPPTPPKEYEVEARGPVHEAYAEPVDTNPEPGPVAAQAPPAAIDEQPPDQKPEGNDVEWIPGYWAWDQDGKDYLWVSGFWRDMPPGRKWVPGVWQEAADGWHWTPGFWAAAQQEAIDYVPAPPQNVDAGPSTAPANPTDVYVPGCWIWRETRFLWRPGYFVAYHPDWSWVPAHYIWTPGGCVFVEGYWDHPLHLRGLLFAPIRPRVQLAFTYTPAYVISADFLLTALFVGPSHRHYYFGDYFEPEYEKSGFVAWINYQPSRRAIDPTFAYYRSAYHGDPAWAQSLTTLYRGRRSGDIPRPPRTLVQQTTVINNITKNNIFNKAVTKNVNITNIQNVTVIRPITQINKTEVTALSSLAPAAKGARPAIPTRAVNLTKINATQINEAKQHVEQVRNLAKQRQQTEAKLLAEPRTTTPRPGTGTAEKGRPPARLELPKGPARTGTPPPAKKSEPTPPARTRPAPPAAPKVPNHVEREVPKREGPPTRTIQPPARREPVPGKKEAEPPAKKGAVPRPEPKKEREVEPPAKKGPLPKTREEPPLPKRAELPPKKAEPPKKEEPKNPPKKKDDGKD